LTECAKIGFFLIKSNGFLLKIGKNRIFLVNIILIRPRLPQKYLFLRQKWEERIFYAANSDTPFFLPLRKPEETENYFYRILPFFVEFFRQLCNFTEIFPYPLSRGNFPFIFIKTVAPGQKMIYN